ncbi:hypothetical protein [Roseateles sp.]|uniref:hypothetical protein n=1 Tax=Roseateles sp. TaxID=1971397 RepID=UPI003BA6A51F
MPSLVSLSSLAWIRTLIWVVVLALPLQAQARLAMLGCSNDTSSSAISSPPAAHDHQAMMAQMDHSGDSAHGSQPSAEEVTDSHAGHACSACAVCCVGAALPSNVLNLSLGSGPGILAPDAGPASLDVITPTLDRPPRSHQRS